MPCRNPRRLYIHLAFTYSASPSSAVWRELGLAPLFPPMRVLVVVWLHALSLVCEVTLIRSRWLRYVGVIWLNDVSLSPLWMEGANHRIWAYLIHPKDLTKIDFGVFYIKEIEKVIAKSNVKWNKYYKFWILFIYLRLDEWDVCLYAVSSYQSPSIIWSLCPHIKTCVAFKKNWFETRIYIFFENLALNIEYCAYVLNSD